MGWVKRMVAERRAAKRNATGAWREAAADQAVTHWTEKTTMERVREEAVVGHRAGAVQFQFQVTLAA